MKDFLLSIDSNFPFEIFGKQHMLMLIITLYLFVIVFIFRKRLSKMNERQFNILRKVCAFIILFNMLIYRGSYIYYGIYDIKIHLSLYYCHIVNYLVVIALLINYNPFYKIVYGLSWIGTIWAVIFPDLSSGVDCFGFYTCFISHNLLLFFVITIVVIKHIKYNFKDFIKSLIIAIIIFSLTNVVNYDFGTNFNSPYSLLGEYVRFSLIGGNDILFILGVIGNIVGLLINKLYMRHNIK